jgi:cytochrome P450
MAMYPDVLKRAQAELDDVVGHDRLPLISDKPRLPYIEAIVLESLRWHPVAPLGDYYHDIVPFSSFNSDRFSSSTY